MMATFYSGQNGRMKIQTRAADTANGVTEAFATLAKVSSWSITSSQSPLPTTTIGDTDATYINGIRNTTGTCRLYYYGDDASASGVTDDRTCSTLIKKLIKAQTAGQSAGVAASPENVVFELEVTEGAASTTKKIKVEALLTSASMSMAVGEVLAADVAFQVNGAVQAITL